MKHTLLTKQEIIKLEKISPETFHNWTNGYFYAARKKYYYYPDHHGLKATGGVGVKGKPYLFAWTDVVNFRRESELFRKMRKSSPRPAQSQAMKLSWARRKSAIGIKQESL